MGKRIGFLILLFALCGFTSTDEQYFRYPSILVNPGFENGKARWTNSGSGTFTLDTSTNLGFGKQSASWDAAANLDTLTSEQVTLPKGLYGQPCRLEFMQKGGDANLTAKVIDGSLATVASQVLATATNFTTVEVDFTCPTSGTVAFQIIAGANSAIVYVDQIYIGYRGVGTSVTGSAQTFSGLKTFADGIEVDDDADQDTLAYYRSESLGTSISVTGAGANNTASIWITRIGDVVHARVNLVIGASPLDATANIAAATIPSWAVPVDNTYDMQPGSFASGEYAFARALSTGAMEFVYRDVDDGTSNTWVVATYRWNMTWNVN